jgi:hypothetical protein
MLEPLDDTLRHQVAAPFSQAGTSDPRFFDRLWFAIYDPAGGAAVQCTIGAYSNLNVMDAGFVAISGDHQRNLRVSRSLRPNWETECGPLRFEAVEPLHQFRVQVQEGEWDIAADIEWTSIAQPEEENQHLHTRSGQLVEDYRRFNQIGRAKGWLSIAGRRQHVSDWWACRDHSWGVRPNIGGIRDTGASYGAGTQEVPSLFLFLFFSTDDLQGHIQLRRDSVSGNYFTATVHSLKDGIVLPIADCRVRATPELSTAIPDTISLSLQMHGREPLELSLEPLGSSIAMPGLGYSGGWNDRLGLGAWRGPFKMETDTWDVSDRAVVRLGDKAWRPRHRIQPVRVRVDGGASGTGSLTWVATGNVRSIFEAEAQPAE